MRTFLVRNRLRHCFAQSENGEVHRALLGVLTVRSNDPLSLTIGFLVQAAEIELSGTGGIVTHQECFPVGMIEVAFASLAASRFSARFCLRDFPEPSVLAERGDLSDMKYVPR